MNHDHQHHSHDGEGHHHAGHGHAHAPANFDRAFAIGITLNIAFVAIEAIYGFLSNSMALLADAGHNLSDVLGLVIAWGASVLAKRPPSERYTYGLGSTSILAALLNAVFLLVATGGIAWEALRRFGDPAPVAGMTVIIVAAIGIVINGVTAWLFASGRKGDINIKGAYLHMAADAGVSAGVVVAGVVILATGWTWVDPAVSLVIALVIAPGASRVVRGTVLAVKQDTFIDAARALGASPGRIVARHVLPNVFAPILVIATVWLGNAIVIEAALSFLGLGTPPPTPTWGAMLSGEGRRNLETAPYLAIFPGLAISIVVLAFNMLGDALRDLLDPRLRSR